MFTLSTLKTSSDCSRVQHLLATFNLEVALLLYRSMVQTQVVVLFSWIFLFVEDTHVLLNSNTKAAAG